MQDNDFVLHGLPLVRTRHPDGHLGWSATGHAQVRAVLADHRFSSRPELAHYPVPGLDGTMPPAPLGDLTGIDPPERTRHRGLLTGWFTVRRTQALTGAVERAAAEHHADRAPFPEQVDLMASPDEPPDARFAAYARVQGRLAELAGAKRATPRRRPGQRSGGRRAGRRRGRGPGRVPARRGRGHHRRHDRPERPRPAGGSPARRTGPPRPVPRPAGGPGPGQGRRGGAAAPRLRAAAQPQFDSSTPAVARHDFPRVARLPFAW